MKFTVKSEHPASAKTGCVILGVFERRKLSEPANRFDKTTRGLLARLLANGDMDGKSGQTLLVHHPHGAKCERVLLVGCGKAADFNSRVFGQAVASAALAVNASGASDAVSYLAELEVKGSDQYHCIRAHVELTQSALYKPDELKSKKDHASRPFDRRIEFRADVAARNRIDLIAHQTPLAERLDVHRVEVAETLLGERRRRAQLACAQCGVRAPCIGEETLNSPEALAQPENARESHPLDTETGLRGDAARVL